MVFIAVDKDRKELGTIKNIQKLDIEIGTGKEDTANTFELTFSASEWTSSDELPTIDYFYVENEEIGGLIRKIKSMTESGKVQASGYTWRGYLDKKIIIPPTGEEHLIVSGDVNDVISSLIDDTYSGLIRGSKEASEFTVSGYQFDRYCTVLEGLDKMLASVGAKLQIKYISSYEDSESTLQRGYAEVSAIPINDYSDKIEFSKEGRIHMIATDDQMGVNHLICLGKGQGVNRTILHLYVDPDGNIGDTQYYTGIDEVQETYDYSSVETTAELRRQGIERLKERKNSRSVECSPGDLDVGLGDIVGAKEEITKIEMETSVSRIIYKVDGNGSIKKEYKVGD